MTTLDLYSGVGGWELGLRLAGIRVDESFEWWEAATGTHDANFGGQSKPVDIRQLDFETLPSAADFVIGSPPCTQFSYSNRGGSGDIQDGLIDIRRFLEAVDRLRPRAWAMENVPRVAEILKRELAPGNSLARYAKLFTTITVVQMEEFGLPQRRRRMLAGAFDEKLFRSYQKIEPSRTLGQVVRALAKRTIRDPIYGIERDSALVSGLEKEQPLSAEETRMNREAKEFHPVYNVMAFPDSLDKPSRTVTAICTRVSRESIVIADASKPSELRRLSARERASLQGFPITFEFHGDSYSDRLKLIGNAIPPPIAYYLSHAFLGTKVAKVCRLEDIGHRLPRAVVPATSLPPDRVGSRYSQNRRFQAAIPGLRFGSGMRFELTNASEQGFPDWRVRFFFGGSKEYRQVDLDQHVIGQVRDQSAWAGIAPSFSAASQLIRAAMEPTDPDGLQSVWSHRSSGMGPYDLVDRLGEAASIVASSAAREKQIWIANLVAGLASKTAEDRSYVLSAISKKFSQYDSRVLAGLLIGSFFNECAASWRESRVGPLFSKSTRIAESRANYRRRMAIRSV